MCLLMLKYIKKYPIIFLIIILVIVILAELFIGSKFNWF